MWTDQNVATLKKFAFEGKSAAWIAVALGAPSRNAVIGKANRIGIKLNGGLGSASNAEGSLPKPPPPREPLAASPTPAGIGWGRVDSTARSRVPVTSRGVMRADRRIYAGAEVGEMRRICLAEIGEVECRWPLGDPTDEDFAYCGLPVARGRAYCAGHCRLAYRAANT
jgi:GcrA cell cycle regulator